MRTGCGAVALSHEHSDHIAAVPVLLRNTDWVFMATRETLAAVQAIHGHRDPAGPADPPAGRPRRGLERRAGPALHHPPRRGGPGGLPDRMGRLVQRRGGHRPRPAHRPGGGPLPATWTCWPWKPTTTSQMLREGGYPPVLKARILSRVGHLSNESMAELLAGVLAPRLKTVVLAHLSEQNNDPGPGPARRRRHPAGRLGTPADLASQQEPLAGCRPGPLAAG